MRSRPFKLARSASGLDAIPAQAPFEQSSWSARCDRLEGGDRERFRPAGRHDRVEHECFDALGVALGVLLGDLGPVGGPVQHELFITAGLADRLEVFDRFLGGVGAARGPDLQRAPFGEPAGFDGEAFQRRAAERVRHSGAALVEDDQIAVDERRGQRLGGEFAERERGLARSARERDHGAAGGRRACRFELEAQRDRARHGAVSLERDGQARAARMRGCSVQGQT